LNEFIPISYTDTKHFFSINGRKINQVKNPVILIPRENSRMNSLQDYFCGDTNLLSPLLTKIEVIDEQTARRTLLQGWSLCSDGGAKDGKGSFGIICTHQNKVILKCHNRVPVTYEDANCHRCEATGILVTLKIIELSHQYVLGQDNNVQPHDMRIICDNESVVNTINRIRGQKLTLKQHYSANMDVLRAVCMSLYHLKKKWRCNILICHVKGHQDDINKFLSFEENLNVQADKLATLGLKEKSKKPIQLPGDRIQLLINDKPVTSHHSKTITNNFHSIQMHKFFKDKYKWSDNTMEGIWWEVHGKTILTFTDRQQTTIQKFLHDRLPTNYRENKYYEYRSAMCYGCKNYIECNNHILQCPKCKTKIKLRKSYIQNLTNLMIKMGTNSTTIRVLISHTRAWLEDLEMPNMSEIAPEASLELIKAVEEQTKIGWDQWFRGRISIRWGELYNNDIQKPNILIKRPSALRWGREIIKQTFQLVLESWYKRNETEHGKEGDPILGKKDKLCEQIRWRISKVDWTSDKDVWTTMSHAEFRSLPTENLEMINSQLKKMTDKGRI
jgi:hypothetical protein